MAYKASDYPQVTRSAQAYDVSKSNRIKAQKAFDDTPSTAKNYATVKAALESAKATEATALKAYRSANTTAKADYDRKTTVAKATSDSKSLDAVVKGLEEQLKKAKDSGGDTKAIQAQLDATKKKLTAAIAAKKPVTIDNRPTGVPATAKFNSVTGQWTAGKDNWDKNGKKIVAKPTTTTTTTKPKPETVITTTTATPATDSTTGPFQGAGGFTDSQNAARLAAEAAAGTNVTPTDFEKLFAEAQKAYGGIDEIFSSNPELKALLIKAMGKVGVTTDDVTENQFINLLENTSWFKTNAGPIRKRGFYQRQYDSLVTKIKKDDPDYKNKIAELDKTSEYGRGLAKVIQALKQEAIEQGKTLDDTTARSLAIDIYKYANEEDTVKISQAVTNAGTFGTAAVGGKAGTALETLRRIAKNNGLDLDVDFADQKDTWLNSILGGETVDKFASLIRQRAGQSQNKFVQDLLKNGYDLNGVYGNYINLMAQYFDIDPNTIKPNDPLLAKVFTDAGGIKFADFEALLRTDARFKGTKQAGATGDIRQSITDRALALGVTLSETEIDDVVNNALSMGVSASSSLVDGLIRAKFSYAPGKILGGAAGGALGQLKATAAANGIDFDKQFGSQGQTWLAKILQGESPETFKNIIRQAASSGLPENVKALLGLGVDLETIYSPYKSIMASVLEINPQTIGLNDKTLRSAIGEKEMTLYEYERSLRKDNRWQYTDNARAETSDATLKVLQDFGFQG